MLVSTSTLHGGVCDGLNALKDAHKQFVEAKLRASFNDSLDIDDGLKAGHEQDYRWDYVLGHRDTSFVVGLEPHSAETGEVSTVIAKRQYARRQLQAHMKPGKSIRAWFWVASGKVDFVPHERTVNRLNQEGITFVGRMLQAKHLPK
jgi:hypothetical protein